MCGGERGGEGGLKNFCDFGKSLLSLFLEKEG